jgi:sugar-specific transcriptional regulator TrmB
MVYSQAHNKATKKYRAKDPEKWKAYIREVTKRSRERWAEYNSELKRLRAIAV